MRSTDTDWAAIGDAEPYFGVLSSSDYLRDNLSEEICERFFVTGEHDIQATLGHIRSLYGASFRARHAIDFGCGVGRLALAMARVSDRVTGIDISPGMLAEALRNADARGTTNIQFLEGDFPAEPADWVNSFLVFQHIVPERGFPLLRRLLECLGPDGVASVHITAYRANDHLQPSFEDVRYSRFDGQSLEVIAPPPNLAAGRMRMYDYDMTRVLATFVDAGLDRIAVEHFDHAGHHAFRVYGRRTAAPGKR